MEGGVKVDIVKGADGAFADCSGKDYDSPEGEEAVGWAGCAGRAQAAFAPVGADIAAVGALEWEHGEQAEQGAEPERQAVGGGRGEGEVQAGGKEAGDAAGEQAASEGGRGDDGGKDGEGVRPLAFLRHGHDIGRDMDGGEGHPDVEHYLAAEQPRLPNRVAAGVRRPA